ncbi:MAG: peptide-methionine (R)-S-oxide reductase, partial [Pseudomonadota bacterium]
MTDTAGSRRSFLGSAIAGIALPLLGGCGAALAQAKSYRITKTEAQWREKLTKGEFYILRQAGTERAYTSPLNAEKRKGTFVCAGCGNKLYSSAHKYDSGTGWPSFWQAIDKG